MLLSTPFPSSLKASNAFIKSSAKVSLFGGSSLIGSHPTGGLPGGEIKKFLSVDGTDNVEVGS